MCDEWKTYVDDPRQICKYGNKCYQKNPQHHTTYKHPPRNLKNNRDKRVQRRFSPFSRNRGEKQINSDSKDTEQDTGKLDKVNKKPEESDTNQSDVEERESNSTTNAEVNLAENEPDTSTSLEQKNKEEQKDNQFCISVQDNLTFYDPATSHSVIEELFLVQMPSDFYKLYDCLNDNNTFEKTLSSVNLEPIGPYDLLLGKLPVLDDKELYLLHWRFFYDPPEFQAVLKKKVKSEYHIGYFRDDPNEKPAFLASNDSAKDCLITPVAENILGAVYLYLQNEKKSPFTAMIYQKLMDKIKIYAEENNYSLKEYNKKERSSRVVTKTFHGAGVVVPYNKKTQLGYRHLVETDANIKKMFGKLRAAKSDSEKDSILSEMQPIITFASIAVDECDFGTGIEAGINLFCSGLKELEPPVLSSLTAVYPLLNREAFSKIIRAHLKLRRRGPDMSILSLIKKENH